MNTMNMPGFTAETSLYKTSGRYQSVATQSYSRGEQRVISQLLLPYYAIPCGVCSAAYRACEEDCDYYTDLDQQLRCLKKCTDRYLVCSDGCTHFPSVVAVPG